MKLAHDLCRNRITSDCSRSAIKTLGLDERAIDKCVVESFTGADATKDDNVLYAEWAEEWRDYGHNLYPSLVINGVIFRGRLTPDNAIEDICSSFNTMPKECRYWYEDENIPLPKGVSTGIRLEALLLIILILTCCSIAVIMIYKRWLQRDLERGMKQQISSAVSRYIALSNIPELRQSQSNINLEESKDTE